MIFAWHSWLLSSLACHTCFDTGHPFIMLISRDPSHFHLLPSVCRRSCHYLFLRLRSVSTGDRNSELPHTKGTFYLYVIAAVWTKVKAYVNNALFFSFANEKKTCLMLYEEYQSKKTTNTSSKSDPPGHANVMQLKGG